MEKLLAQKESRSLGFTLIELLIVVTIIAILAAIGLVSYGVFLKITRDAKRQADLKLIQSALEQYHADQKYYPASINFGDRLTNATGVAPAPSVTKVYLNSVPKGPTNTPEYLYKGYKSNGIDECQSLDVIGCVKYCLYAKAENLTQMIDLCPNQPDYTLEVTSP